MLRDFKAFVTRGPVVDLAVAVVVAFALVQLIRALVVDVVAPLVGIPGGLDFGDLAVTVNGSEIRYGSFLNELISFLITAAAVFFGVVRPLSRFNARTAPAPTPTAPCPRCLSTVPEAATKCPFCTADIDRS